MLLTTSLHDFYVECARRLKSSAVSGCIDHRRCTDTEHAATSRWWSHLTRIHSDVITHLNTRRQVIVERQTSVTEPKHIFRNWDISADRTTKTCTSQDIYHLVKTSRNWDWDWDWNWNWNWNRDWDTAETETAPRDEVSASRDVSRLL